MNKVFLAGLVSSVLLVAGEAAADPLRVGGAVDVGVPSGATASVVVSPLLSWLQVSGGMSYNAMSPGLRAGLTLDPMPWAVGLTLGGDVGGFFPGTVPGVDHSPTFSYTYEDLDLGVRFGRRNHFNFFIRGGISHIDLNASNFQGSFTLPVGATVGDPHVSATLPSAKLGFSLLF